MVVLADYQSSVTEKLLTAREPTPEERRDQRVSFVMGSVGETNPITKDQVRALVDKTGA